MLWSLLKVLLFVVAIAALTWGASLLLETGGGIRLAAGGYEMTLGPLQAVIGLLILMLGIWLLMRLIGLIVATLRFFNGDETAISRYFDRDRQRKGYQALSDGFLALASGEARLALLRAQRAEKYLERPELTTLLVAQAAEAAGDSARASEAFKKLLADESTRFVGIRGLLHQKLAEGDTDTALKLAEKAFALKPKHGETQDILLKLQSDSADWKGARATLGAKLKTGALPKVVFRRRDAVLACGGFNEYTLTDDLDLSLRLVLGGHPVGVLWDPPVGEEAVLTLPALWRQRQRWAEGGLQRFLDHGFGLGGGRLSRYQTLDLLAFFLLQYGMPVLAAADLLGVLLTGTPPLMWPFSIVALSSSALALVAGCRRAREGPALPPMTPFHVGLAILYLTHWFVVIPWVSVRMALLPKRLVWAKTLPLGDDDEALPQGDDPLATEGEGELAAGGGQA